MDGGNKQRLLDKKEKQQGEGRVEATDGECAAVTSADLCLIPYFSLTLSFSPLLSVPLLLVSAPGPSS